MKKIFSKTTTQSLILLLFTVSFSKSFSQSCGTFLKIAKGHGVHSLSIKNDGSFWVWGNNQHGQLGDGSQIDRHSPVQIGASSNWNSIAEGFVHSLAIKTDGTLWAWGQNVFGALGIGNTLNQSNPIQTGIDNDWATIAGGDYNSLAIKTDGTLWAWGRNTWGQLGDATTTHRYSPVKIGTSNDWAIIAAGSKHGLAIKTDGSLWAWGNNNSGQLGDGTIIQRLSPVQIGMDTDWATISAGYSFSHAIKTDGSLWAWGDNFDGQLGDASAIQRNSPTQIGSDIDWADVSSGFAHGLAIKANGSLWAWGANTFGEVGDGTTQQRNNPKQITMNFDWTFVAARGHHSLAIKTNSSLWAWGNNGSGRLGDGTTTNKLSPVQTLDQSLIAIIANADVEQTLTIGSITYFHTNCTNLITAVNPLGSQPINGSTTAKVWIENTQPMQYVKRHYEITPAINATTATGKITLYFTDDEFNAFNTQGIPPALLLPLSTDDPATIAVRKTNLRIEKRPGISNNGTGLPATYTGTPVTIDPNDTDILWNVTANRWEISFDVTGFSGFFVKTIASVLPLNILTFSGTHITNTNQLNWLTTNEVNTKYFILERSTDGIAFVNIGQVNTNINSSNNSYVFTDNNLQNDIYFYRLKIIDNDGFIKYSKTIKIINNKNQLLTISPNPVKNAVIIGGLQSKGVLKLLSLDGKLLQQKNINTQTITLSLQGYANGIYLISYYNNKNTVVQKIIKY